MTYTDQDILDLYTDLLSIGAAVTPAEEAEALYKAFKVYADEHLSPSKLIWTTQVSEELIKFLQAKSIPVTYLIKWRSYHSPDPIPGKSQVQGIYPIYKGLVIYPKVLPLGEFILDKGWAMAMVEIFDTAEELDAAVAAAELEWKKG